MGGRLLVCVLVALCSLTAVARASEPIYIPWTNPLPPLPGPAGNSGGPQPHCDTATIACIDTEISRMATLQQELGCDHRDVFDTTYLELTKVLRDTMSRDPHFFADPTALIYEDALFAEMYFRAVENNAAGRRVDPAWQIAFDAAKSGDYTATGDMLLGINAHVENDMPFLLEAITLRDANGRSRKPDHDKMNEVLNAAFQPVVREIARRFDPITRLETVTPSPVTDYFGVELVRGWREMVWRNAERLVYAKSAAAHRRVAASIHLQAAVAGRLIAAGNQAPPGYRAQRDAYCERQL
jgi:hypothetical protein